MPISFECPHCGATTDVAEQYAGQTGPCATCGQTITVPGVALGARPAARGGSAVAIIAIVAGVVMAGVCVVGVLIALMLPAVQASRGAARRVQCTNNMRQIAFAMHAYNDMHGTLPPAYLADENGTPMHSWRVLLLPFLDQQQLYDDYDFDEPWDGPNNRLLADRFGDIYVCSDSGDEPPLTNYVVITGPGTLFEPGKTVNLNRAPDTALVVEIFYTDIDWMEPRDLDVGRMSFSIDDSEEPSISSGHPGGVNVALANGDVRFVDSNADPEVVESMILVPADEAAP